MGEGCRACQGHEGDEKGSHEAPRHEGSSASKGHEGDEEGSHEAPRHEGSSASKGHEGDEEGSHEAPCHEGSSASTKESHEGHEVNVTSGFCSGCGDVHACGAPLPATVLDV